MKSVLIALALSAASLELMGMGDEVHQHDHSEESSVQQIYSASGKIKSISENGESVRIFHDPVPALKWPAMNMKFEFSESVTERSFTKEEAVRFDFIEKEGRYIIIKISK
ncbi:copper-binding protein [Sulfuricurvum sp. IAE1]|uniref:copper-binding protein n=1 Tax=Sulfuricurvum sp. IAE1 TaxID=2546102 RepID=UPI0010479770|nr:copper-binding protein [Sulfuricurvum sp. IAE1]MDD3770067.1 copper-binding protein [Sulfuricurvum sp.]TDA69173.1 copper-binding protein [Sulfuricurvum sp. IAE1]